MEFAATPMMFNKYLILQSIRSSFALPSGRFVLLLDDDDFELIWPATYEEIGKVLGGSSQILLARQPGDLQFLCTDQRTERHNRITHVAMVADENQIVHARGVDYGVCLNHIGTYDGKVCALTRYNPQGTLRIGMCGKRTLALQKALNRNGADLNEDGEFSEKTQAAVIEYQIRYDMEPTGQADRKMLFSLSLLEKEQLSSLLSRIMPYPTHRKSHSPTKF